MASTVLKGESHGWTANCRDNEKARTKYFPMKASGGWNLAQLKYDENKNRRHVVLSFDPYWEKMDIVKRTRKIKNSIVNDKDRDLVAIEDGRLK